MRAVLGVVSLLVALAAVALLASGQLRAIRAPLATTGKASSAGTASAPPVGAASPTMSQRVVDDVAKAMAQGASKDESGR